MTRVINLWGGPGSGKSTLASGLFARMKMRDLKVELVTEYAKELTYAGRLVDRSDQLYVLAEQNARIARCAADVDWVITDSPLPVGLIYGQGEYREPWFRDAVWAVFNRYRNVNVFVQRAKPYQTYGRTQSEAEARALDEKMRDFAGIRHADFMVVRGDPHGPERLLSLLEERYAIPSR